MAIGDLDVAPAFERCKHHEDVGGAVALVLVIAAGRASPLHREAGASRQGTAWRSRPGTPAGNRDRVAACRPPAHLPWRLRPPHLPSPGLPPPPPPGPR